MENSLRVAGDSKSAAEELQRLRFELDNHNLGKSDNEKLAAELESEKKILEQNLAHVEDEKREALERISTLETSLQDVTQAKTALEEELEIVKETMEREAEDNETAQGEHR
jgi:chromosome segregation ATPase